MTPPPPCNGDEDEVTHPHVAAVEVGVQVVGVYVEGDEADG